MKRSKKGGKKTVVDTPFRSGIAKMGRGGKKHAMAGGKR
jgi:hypothetical protein